VCAKKLGITIQKCRSRWPSDGPAGRLFKLKVAVFLTFMIAFQLEGDTVQRPKFWHEIIKQILSSLD
jgi:hypothetical protein